MFECLCHSEERSDEESLSYFNRPFVSLRVTDEMREILRYAQNDLSNWLFTPINYNLHIKVVDTFLFLTYLL